MKPKELETRLIKFSGLIIELIQELQDNKAGNHLSGQLIRSSTAPALIYGEAQSAESKKDFVHKMQLILKELRETYIALKIVEVSSLCKCNSKMNCSLNECNELISIFVVSVRNAKSRR